MKKWYESKTIWINLIAVVLEVGNALMTNPIIPTKFAGVLTVVVTVLNIILRTISSTTISK